MPELDPDWQTIMDMFHGRCVLCSRTANAVHEIIPRSSGSMAFNIANRVSVCYTCHEWAHKVGIKQSAPILREAREKALQRYANR